MTNIEPRMKESFPSAILSLPSDGPTTLSSSNVLAKESGGLIQGFQVQSLGHGLVHYKVIVRVGAGPYNMIDIHRVVKENAPGRPVNSRDVLFYQHGDGKDFEGMMLPELKGSSTPIDFGMGVYLAENGVDVWGIDQAWNLVPGTVTNFDFMKNWGLQKNVDDLRLAIAVARATRFLTGCGFDRVILSGYSSGVATSVALLNEETQRSPCDRQVRGYVPVDLAIKTPPSSLKDVLAADAIRLRGLYNSGTYSYETGMPPIGMLARTAANPNFGSILNATILQVCLTQPGFPQSSNLLLLRGGLSSWSQEHTMSQPCSLRNWKALSVMRSHCRLMIIFRRFVCQYSIWRRRVGPVI